MFKSFKSRSTQKELMDDGTIGYTAFASCLHDLVIVNVLSLGHRPTLSWFKRIIRNLKVEQTITILDVGSGGGDMLRRIAQMAELHKQNVALTGVDLNPWSAQYAQSVTPPSLSISFETANIFDFARDKKFDFVMSSLFTHHLSDKELVLFLQWMEQHATKGWVINDLHRHPLPYYFFKYISRLLPLDHMVRHDGVISVARAFTKADWTKALVNAGIPLEQTTIRWWFPFRYVVTRHKP